MLQLGCDRGIHLSIEIPYAAGHKPSLNTPHRETIDRPQRMTNVAETSFISARSPAGMTRLGTQWLQADAKAEGAAVGEDAVVVIAQGAVFAHIPCEAVVYEEAYQDGGVVVHGDV